jgi:hypothetical protein
MSPAPFCWLHVPPERRDELAAHRGAGREIAELTRRGVDHGALVVGGLEPVPPEDPDRAWQEGAPIHVPGVLGEALEEVLDDALATWQAFEEFRGGARLLDEIDRRLVEAEEFLYAGSTFDLDEPREVEKVFVDVPAVHTSHGRRIRDLWAKLSWVADDERDLSMRIRLSFGHEATRDWLVPDVRALWSDRMIARAFPETRCVTGNDVIADFLAGVLPRPHRLGECIVYGNAPGGGAVFHHDADPGQRGVVFAQLLGATVWLACPRRELAERAATRAGVARLHEPDAVLRAMDGGPDPELWALLNASPALTADLAAAGRMFLVRAGDVLLLPSIDAETCAWHAVFGVGTKPSLALSFGIFDALGELPGAPPPLP